MIRQNVLLSNANKSNVYNLNNDIELTFPTNLFFKAPQYIELLDMDLNAEINLFGNSNNSFYVIYKNITHLIVVEFNTAIKTDYQLTQVIKTALNNPRDPSKPYVYLPYTGNDLILDITESSIENLVTNYKIERESFTSAYTITSNNPCTIDFGHKDSIGPLIGFGNGLYNLTTKKTNETNYTASGTSTQSISTYNYIDVINGSGSTPNGDPAGPFPNYNDVNCKMVLYDSNKRIIPNKYKTQDTTISLNLGLGLTQYENIGEILDLIEDQLNDYKNYFTPAANFNLAYDNITKKITLKNTTGAKFGIGFDFNNITRDRVMYSSNSTNWYSAVSVNNNDWRSLAYARILNDDIIVAVSSNGSNNRIMRAINTTNNWQSIDSPYDNIWTSVAYHQISDDPNTQDQHLYVAIASRGINYRVMTSYDCINWSYQISPLNDWKALIHNGIPGQKKFVAVASSGIGNRVMTSFDGFTWNSQISAADNDWSSLTYGGLLGQEKFVAVANSGIGNRVMTSIDGFTWSIQTSAADNNWNSICWGGLSGQEKFVAVASSGIGNRVMTSSDGITWSTQLSAADNNWTSICWGGISGEEKFVAISSFGLDKIGNRVMTSTDGINWSLQTIPNPYTNENNYINSFQYVDAGGSHSLAILKNGTIKAWGNNTNGQLGDGTIIQKNGPIIVNNLTDVISVAAGENFSLALLKNGLIKCWGNNDYGQLGNNTTTQISIPSTVLNIEHPIAISAGLNHSMALLANGTIKTWGRNNYGQLGNNTTTNSIIPTDVIGINNAIAISAGKNYSLALLSDGTIKAWGLNDYGQLGNGTTINSIIPISVSSINNAILISASLEGHSLALLSDGTIKSWGKNDYGQLGNNTTTQQNSPVNVLNITNAIKISAGKNSSFAILNNGTVKSWGRNNEHQLGDGTTTQSNIPVSVLNINNALYISSNDHSLVIINNGTIKSFGNNTNGQLGNNTIISSDAVLVQTSETDIRTLYNIRFTFEYAWNSIIWSTLINKFIAISSELGNYMISSIDGITWELSMISINYEWKYIYDGPEFLIGIGKSVGISEDIYKWNEVKLLIDNYWTSVCRGGLSGEEQFVAVASSGIKNRIMTSYDGTDWIIRYNPVDNNWTSVCWGGSSGQEKYVAVASTGSSNRIMTSSNGIIWTTRTSPADNNWTSVCWSSDLNLFVAVASSGIGNRVMTSSDGITWLTQASAANNNWTSVCWGGVNGQKKFVAVASSGTGNRIMTSSDGINWTIRVSPADNNWSSVVWTGLNRFVAVASSGVTNRIMSSSDGINWSETIGGTLYSPLNSPINMDWNSIIWVGGDLNRIVSVGSSFGNTSGSLHYILGFEQTSYFDLIDIVSITDPLIYDQIFADDYVLLCSNIVNNATDLNVIGIGNANNIKSNNIIFAIPLSQSKHFRPVDSSYFRINISASNFSIGYKNKKFSDTNPNYVNFYLRLLSGRHITSTSQFTMQLSFLF
jgi:alpha-tubulin suppressor-like RCC1 family protein